MKKKIEKIFEFLSVAASFVFAVITCLSALAMLALPILAAIWLYNRL